jgi:hypothetical protein
MPILLLTASYNGIEAVSPRSRYENNRQNSSGPDDQCNLTLWLWLGPMAGPLAKPAISKTPRPGQANPNLFSRMAN